MFYLTLLMLISGLSFSPASAMDKKRPAPAPADVAEQPVTKKLKTEQEASAAETKLAADSAGTAAAASSISSAPQSSTAQATAAASASGAHLYAAAQPIQPSTSAAASAPLSNGIPAVNKPKNGLVSASGKYMIASQEDSADSSKKAPQSRKKTTLQDLSTEFDQLVASEQFNAEDIEDIETTYSKEIKEKLAALVAEKYQADLNRLTKPGIETAVATAALPYITRFAKQENKEFSDLFEQQFSKPKKFNNALRAFGIQLTSYLHLPHENFGLALDAKGCLYIYDTTIFMLRELPLSMPMPAAEILSYHASNYGLAVAAKMENNKIQIIIFDWIKYQQYSLILTDLDAKTKICTISLVNNNTFCLIGLENSTIVVRVETGITCTLRGTPQESDNNATDIMRLTVWKDGALRTGIPHEYNLCEFPLFNSDQLAATQYKVMFDEQDDIRKPKFIVFNHDETWGLVRCDNQLSLHNLDTGTCYQIPKLDVSIDSSMVAFDYHEDSKQLIILFRFKEKELYLLLIDCSTKQCKKITYTVNDQFKKCTRLMFNSNGTHCILSEIHRIENHEGLDPSDEEFTTCIDLLRNQSITREGKLCGKPNRYAILFDNEEKYIDIFDLKTLSPNKSIEFDEPEEDYCPRMSEAAHYRNVIVSPDGRYLVSAYGDTQTITLKDNISIWDLKSKATKKRICKVVNQGQDSFMRAINFYNNKYFLGVCSKGYCYIGDAETAQLYQLPRSRMLPENDIAAYMRCVDVQFSADKKYIYTAADIEYFAASTADAQPDFGDDTGKNALSDMNRTSIERIYKIDQAHSAHVPLVGSKTASALTLPQLLMLIKLTKENQFFDVKYHPLMRQLHPQLKKCLELFALKKIVSTVIPPKGLPDLISQYVGSESQDQEQSEGIGPQSPQAAQPAPAPVIIQMPPLLPLPPLSNLPVLPPPINSAAFAAFMPTGPY